SPEYTRDVFANKMEVGFHTGSDVGLANKLTLDTCNVVKGDNIEIYTVSFGTDVDADTKNLLRSCATNSNNYFDAATNNDLVSTFQSIADSIVTVYLSQ
ncbi:MAG: hypothetical protein AAGA76_09725, partial [Pseudomonadota bacterium]